MSGRMVSGIVAGSLVGVAIGFLVRPRSKTMSLMRRGMRMMKW